MHLASLVHSNHAIYIVGVSRGWDIVKGGEILSRGGEILSRGGGYLTPSPPLKEAQTSVTILRKTKLRKILKFSVYFNSKLKAQVLFLATFF